MGEGSSGEVYKGTNRATGEVVAVKIIDVAQKEKVQAIRNEILMMKRSQHECVVEHKGSYMKDDKLWVWLFPSAFCGRPLTLLSRL